MYHYPKKILTIEEQIKSYEDAGMKLASREEMEAALKEISYYRLRGYSFHLYDNSTKKYKEDTRFETILKLYYFEDLTLQEIADLEGCSVKNVYKSIEQAKEKIAKNLKNYKFRGKKLLLK